MFVQFGYLRVPHEEIGAQLIREHQCGSVGSPLELIINVTAVDVCDWHIVKRAPEARRCPGRPQCTLCRVHIVSWCAAVDTWRWSPAARRLRRADGRAQWRRRLDSRAPHRRERPTRATRPEPATRMLRSTR